MFKCSKHGNWLVKNNSFYLSCLEFWSFMFVCGLRLENSTFFGFRIYLGPNYGHVFLLRVDGRHPEGEFYNSESPRGPEHLDIGIRFVFALIDRFTFFGIVLCIATDRARRLRPFIAVLAKQSLCIAENLFQLVVDGPNLGVNLLQKAIFTFFCHAITILWYKTSAI